MSNFFSSLLLVFLEMGDEKFSDLLRVLKCNFHVKKFSLNDDMEPFMIFVLLLLILL